MNKDPFDFSFDEIVSEQGDENEIRVELEEIQSERDYALENCTPYQVKVGSSILEDGSWGDLLCKLVECLLDMKPEKREHIEDFRTPWTKTAMFATSRKTNYKQIDESL